MNSNKVAVFDFDGTITKRDTLLPFLRRYGYKNFARPLVLTFFRKRSYGFRETLKRRILNEIFSGYPETQLEDDGRRYASSLDPLYRSEMLSRVRDHQRKGHRLILISASLGCYARPAAFSLGFHHVFAVELDSHHGLITGEIIGRNMRGAEKARKLKEYLGGENPELWVYGNSSGDREMLEMADHPVKVS